MKCVFTCPPPPSTNNLYVNRRDGKGRARTSAYKAWIAEAALLVGAQHPAPMAGRSFSVLIEAPFGRRRDIDNIKPVLDLAVMLGLIEDDRLVDELYVARIPEGLPMRVRIVPLGIVVPDDRPSSA